MSLKPLGDRVVVIPKNVEKVTAGGIIIPDTNQKEKPIEGTVFAVGSGYLNKDGSKTPLEVKEGDIVLFGKYTGTQIKLNGDDALIMEEKDIFGILNVK